MLLSFVEVVEVFQLIVQVELAELARVECLSSVTWPAFGIACIHPDAVTFP